MTSPSETMWEKWRHDRNTSFKKKSRFFVSFIDICIWNASLLITCSMSYMYMFNFKFMFYICVIVVELVFVDIGFYSFFLLHVLNSIRHIIYQDYHYWVIQPKKSCCEGWLLFPIGQQQSSFPMSPEFMILFLPRYVSCLKMALLQMYVYLIIIWLITFLIITF